MDDLLCRTCLIVIPPNSIFYKLDDSKQYLQSFHIKTKLEYCIPEFNIGLLENPIICRTCENDLTVSYDFRKKCLETEGLIREYRNNTTAPTRGSINQFIAGAIKKDNSKENQIVKQNKVPLQRSQDNSCNIPNSCAVDVQEDVVLIDDDIEFISDDLPTARHNQAQNIRNPAVINTNVISIVPIARTTSDQKTPKKYFAASSNYRIVKTNTVNTINKIPLVTPTSKATCRRSYEPKKNSQAFSSVEKHNTPVVLTNLPKSGDINDISCNVFSNTRIRSNRSCESSPILISTSIEHEANNKEEQERIKTLPQAIRIRYSSENLSTNNCIAPNSTSETVIHDSTVKETKNKNTPLLPGTKNSDATTSTIAVLPETTKDSVARNTRSSSNLTSTRLRRGNREINVLPCISSQSPQNSPLQKTKKILKNVKAKSPVKNVSNMSSKKSPNVEMPSTSNKNSNSVRDRTSRKSISNDAVPSDLSPSSVKKRMPLKKRRYSQLNNDPLCAGQTSTCDPNAKILKKLPLPIIKNNHGQISTCDPNAKTPKKVPLPIIENNHLSELLPFKIVNVYSEKDRLHNIKPEIKNESLTENVSASFIDPAT